MAGEKVILILGDSLSAGYGIDVQKSWTALLQRRLAESGYPHRIENASISGDTTSGGLARLPALLKRHRPVMVVIELGANDGLRGIPIAEAERNLQRMLELILAMKAKTMLLEMRMPPNYGPRYAQQFENLYARLGIIENVHLVPFFLHDVVLDQSLMQNDGLHPNVNAQPKMLKNVWKYLNDELE